MTLIAFGAGHESADIITDSTSYTSTFTELGHCSKALHLQHLDTMVLSQGDANFARTWQWLALQLGEQSPDLDTFLEHTPTLLEDAWAHAVSQWRAGGRTDDPPRSVGMLVGYSPAEGRFVAVTFPSDRGFVPEPVDGLFVHPSPLSVRPSDYELRGIRETVRADLVRRIEALPEPPQPRSPEEWANIALIARESRSYLDPTTGLKVFVGGSVFHTHLERGRVETSRVLQFDQDPEDFQAVIAGTLHPQSQLGPCGCGSDTRYLDCCLAPHLDEPCLCGSGSPLRDCCSVDFSGVLANSC